MNAIKEIYKNPARTMKLLGYTCLALSLISFMSGCSFIERYDIGGSSTSVVEAALMQVAALRYLTGAVFLLIASLLLVARQFLLSNQEHQGITASNN